MYLSPTCSATPDKGDDPVWVTSCLRRHTLKNV